MRWTSWDHVSLETSLWMIHSLSIFPLVVQLPQCRFNDTQLNVCLKDRAEKILTFPSVNPLILNSPLFNLPLQKMLGDKLKFEELEIKRLRRMKVENVQIVIEKPELIYQIRYLAAGLTVSGISGYEFCKGEFSVFLQNLEADVKIVGSLKTEGQHEYLTLHTATNAHSLKSLQFNSFKDKCNSLSAAFFEGLRKFQVFAADKCYSTSKFQFKTMSLLNFPHLQKIFWKWDRLKAGNISIANINPKYLKLHNRSLWLLSILLFQNFHSNFSYHEYKINGWAW